MGDLAIVAEYIGRFRIRVRKGPINGPRLKTGSDSLVPVSDGVNCKHNIVISTAPTTESRVTGTNLFTGISLITETSIFTGTSLLADA